LKCFTQAYRQEARTEFMSTVIASQVLPLDAWIGNPKGVGRIVVMKASLNATLVPGCQKDEQRHADGSDEAQRRFQILSYFKRHPVVASSVGRMAIDPQWARRFKKHVEVR